MHGEKEVVKRGWKKTVGMGPPALAAWATADLERRKGALERRVLVGLCCKGVVPRVLALAGSERVLSQDGLRWDRRAKRSRRVLARASGAFQPERGTRRRPTISTLFAVSGLHE